MNPNKRPPQFKRHLVALIVVVLAVLKIFSDPGLIKIAVGQDSPTAEKDFRFEDYSGPQFDSEAQAIGAATAALSKVFPKGSLPEHFSYFMESIGGYCMERSEPKYIETHGNALYCRYEHPFAGMSSVGQHWIIYVFRDQSMKKISAIKIKTRLVAP